MRGRTLLGMETEYALGREPGSDPWRLSRVTDVLMDVARSAERPHVTGRGEFGVFLGNGARFYVDRGWHPEYATPECEDPWQVVACARAGERYLLELLADAERVSPMARRTTVFRCAVDYSRRNVSWGCHESYLHRTDPALLPDQLLPHLVSRTIYSGAGGFHPTAPGLEFTLSPRAWLLTVPVSGNSTVSRGIFHTKNEPLSGHRWRRMHVICGESLSSDRGSVLKLGTTALVLAAIDAGWRPASGLELAAPVEALRTIAADPGCTVPVELANGRRISALEIQRGYLRQVEACRRQGHLPEWAADLCALWRSTLDGLQRGDPSVIRELDWGLKLAVYRDRARQHGLDWNALPIWSAALRRLERVAARVFDAGGPQIADLLRDHARFHKEIDRITPVLRGAGMEWGDARTLIRLRHELLETDLRFGQLGPAGIYEQLAGAGWVRSDAGRRVPDPRPLVTTPPGQGRAQVRGDTVRALWRSGQARNYRADWHLVTGPQERGQLDLSDPFCERAVWVTTEQVLGVVQRVAEAGT